MNKADVVKKLQTADALFIAYSRATQLPFVICDEESFNDQAMVFASEDGVKAFGVEQLKSKNLIIGVKVEKQQYAKFYGTLFGLGINSIVYHEDDEKFEVELTDVARQVDFSKMPEEKRPLLNPSFQLSAMYFMQEMRRPVKPEERSENLKELEEELLANMRKATYLLPMEIIEKEGEERKINLPFIKTKEGKTYQPAFTDIMELEKFAKGKKMGHAKVPFANLSKFMVPNSEGLVVNPNGVNLILQKNQMKKA